MAKEIEIGDEYLSREDHKALALIKESLGQRGFENARLLLLREHAKRIVKVTPEQINGALSAIEGGNGPRGTGLLLLTKKFVMENPGLVIQFRNYLTDLRDGKIGPVTNSVACDKCGATFSNKNSLRNHNTMAHTSTGKKVRMAAKRNRKKRNG